MAIVKPKATNINQLARKTKSFFEDIKRWHEEVGMGYEDEEKSIALIRSHQRPRNPTVVDPKTNLSWPQAKAKQEAIKLERENLQKERASSGDWVTAEHHLRILSGLCAKFEQAPGKIKSQLGLTAEQEIQVRKIFDDIRAEYVDGLTLAPPSEHSERNSATPGIKPLDMDTFTNDPARTPGT